MRHHFYDAHPSSHGDAPAVSFVKSDYVGGLRMPRHFDPETRITLVVAGGCTETVGRSESYCSPGSVVLKPAGADHANVFGDHGMTAFSIRFSSTAAVRPDAHRWTHGGPIARRMFDLYQRIASERNVDAEAIDADLLDVLALLTSAVGDDRAGHLPPWLDDVRSCLHESYPHRVSVHDLAAVVDTHPVYLARVFRRRFGCSVIEYVHRLRTQHAARLLGRTDEPCAQIAVRVGFADQAHLCRVFKRHAGVTPAAYRQLVRNA